MFASRWHTGIIPEALSVRRAVFVEEQGISIAVPDDLDAYAMQLVVEEDGIPVASARLVPEDGGVRLAFVAVLPEYRGQGFGDLCVRQALYKAQSLYAPRVFARVAQQHRTYFEAFGFAGVDLESTKNKEIELAAEITKLIWHSPCKKER